MFRLQSLAFSGVGGVREAPLAGWCVRGPAVIAGKGCLIDFQTPNFPPHQAAAAAAVCAE